MEYKIVATPAFTFHSNYLPEFTLEILDLTVARYNVLNFKLKLKVQAKVEVQDEVEVEAKVVVE